MVGFDMLRSAGGRRQGGHIEKACMIKMLAVNARRWGWIGVLLMDERLRGAMKRICACQKSKRILLPVLGTLEKARKHRHRSTAVWADGDEEGMKRIGLQLEGRAKRDKMVYWRDGRKIRGAGRGAGIEMGDIPRRTLSHTPFIPLIHSSSCSARGLWYLSCSCLFDTLATHKHVPQIFGRSDLSVFRV